jgi:hypothetical protein
MDMPSTRNIPSLPLQPALSPDEQERLVAATVELRELEDEYVGHVRFTLLYLCFLAACCLYTLVFSVMYEFYQLCFWALYTVYTMYKAQKMRRQLDGMRAYIRARLCDTVLPVRC